MLIAGVLVGSTAVVVPFMSWHQRWSDRTSWPVPLLVAMVAVFAVAGR